DYFSFEVATATPAIDSPSFDVRTSTGVRRVSSSAVTGLRSRDSGSADAKVRPKDRCMYLDCVMDFRSDRRSVEQSSSTPIGNDRYGIRPKRPAAGGNCCP